MNERVKRNDRPKRRNKYPSPVPPEGVVERSLPGGQTIKLVEYGLYGNSVMGRLPRLRPETSWEPRPELGLEAAMPLPWDLRGHGLDDQFFHPKKFWDNAVAIDLYLSESPPADLRDKAVQILDDLVERMRTFIVADGAARFVEMRYDAVSKGIRINAPWVSALSNAFLILGCLRMRRYVDIETDLAGLAEAFSIVQVEGETALPRWISYKDRHGYLWFDEYPQPDGIATRVKNGHIFAVLALHELARVMPGKGFETFVQAGAATIEAYVHAFRQPGEISVYALGAPNKPDYLPGRAMRQLYELYLLTGSGKFLLFADLFTRDARAHATPGQLRTIDQRRALGVATHSPGHADREG